MRKTLFFLFLVIFSSCSKKYVDVYMNEDSQLIFDDSSAYYFSFPQRHDIYDFANFQYCKVGDTIFFKDYPSKTLPYYWEFSNNDNYSSDSLYIFSDSYDVPYVLVNDTNKVDYNAGLESLSFLKKEVNNLKIGNKLYCYLSEKITVGQENVLNIYCNFNCSYYDDQRNFDLTRSIAYVVGDTLRFEQVYPSCRKIRGMDSKFYYYGKIKNPRKFKDYSSVKFRDYIFLKTHPSLQ